MADNKPVKVIKATTKKQSIAGDLGKYAMDEIIVPKSKEVMRDMFTGIVNMFAEAARSSMDKFLYPDGGAPTRSTGQRYYTGTTNYTSYSRPIAQQYQPSNQQVRDNIGQRSGVDVKCIWVSTEEDAKDILSTLCEEIDNYNKAKVATLYEKIGEKTTFADFKYGWTNKDDLKYYYDSSSPDPNAKWFIDLPKPVDITTV
jgi:hypothetical protein